MSDLFSASYVSNGSSPWSREAPLTDGHFPASPRTPPTSAAGPFITLSERTLRIAVPGFLPSPPLAWDCAQTYCSRVEKRKRHGALGPGWFLSNDPFLVPSTRGAQNSVIRAIAGDASVLWFRRDENGSWQSHGDDCVKLAHDFVNRTFELLDATGTKWVFHSFDSSLPRQTQGRLKRLVSPDGRPITLEYSQADAPSHIGWTSPEGDAMEMSYEYREASDLTPRLTQGTLLINRLANVRLRYQFNQLDMLHSITKEAAKITDWTTEFQVTFWYGADPAHPHGPPLLDRLEYLNLQENSLQSTKYQIRYSKNGRVKWVHSEGPGPKPVYLD